MKFLLVLLLGLAALSATDGRAAPLGTRTSQATTFSVTLDDYAYRVNSMATYTRTAQGMSVSTGQANLFSVSQPSGPQNNQGYTVFFVIPEGIIDLYY
jgi:hypothetical protein